MVNNTSQVLSVLYYVCYCIILSTTLRRMNYYFAHMTDNNTDISGGEISYPMIYARDGCSQEIHSSLLIPEPAFLTSILFCFYFLGQLSH